MNAATPADEWRAYSACATVESSATFVQAGFYYKQFSNNGGTMFVDSLHFEAVAPIRSPWMKPMGSSTAGTEDATSSGHANASNYDPTANEDDMSCTYSIHFDIDGVEDCRHGHRNVWDASQSDQGMNAEQAGNHDIILCVDSTVNECGMISGATAPLFAPPQTAPPTKARTSTTGSPWLPAERRPSATAPGTCDAVCAADATPDAGVPDDTSDAGVGETTASLLLLDMTTEGTPGEWETVADAANGGAPAPYLIANSLSLSGTNPSSAAGKAYIFQYVSDSVDYQGATRVRVSFDVKIDQATDAAVHAQLDLPGHGVANLSDLQNQATVGSGTWTNITYEADVTPAASFDQFLFHINIAAGAVENAGASLLLDNVHLEGIAFDEPVDDGALLANGGFETGVSGWTVYSDNGNNNFAAAATGDAFFNSADTLTVQEGDQGAKVWGLYSGADNDISVFQEWLNGLTPGNPTSCRVGSITPAKKPWVETTPGTFSSKHSPIT